MWYFLFDFLLNNIKSVHKSPCSHVYIIITQQLPTFLYLLFLNFGICWLQISERRRVSISDTGTGIAYLRGNLGSPQAFWWDPCCYSFCVVFSFLFVFVLCLVSKCCPCLWIVNPCLSLLCVLCPHVVRVSGLSIPDCLFRLP